jgi:hypothetical protein
MKKALHIAVLLVAVMFSVAAIARLQDPIDDLRNNAEYVELQHADRELAMREDSVSMVIASTRERFRVYSDSLRGAGVEPTPEVFSHFSDRILELEQQVFDIRTMRGDVIARINAMEQEWVLAQMDSPVEEERAEERVEEPVVKPIYRNLVENYCIRDVLGDEDYAELLEAQREDIAMDSLVAEYYDMYARLKGIVERYQTTDSEAEAEELYAQFAQVKAEIAELAEKIDRHWNHVLDTKYYAYGYVLERNYHYDLLDSSSMEFTEMRRNCSREAGYYETDALMHYALGRNTLRSFERDFARTMGLEEAADSIAALQQEARVVEYRLEPVLSPERRLFIDYQPIIIGRTNFYKESNPLPELKVYERGTIYRIRLGEFRSKQPMTLFKGVQPLYIERNDKGNYVYYTGGFATRADADDAQLFLKEKGFKAPEICRWQNGEMVNISSLEEEEGVDVLPLVGKRYMIKITAETLSEDVRELIATEAPRKSVSKEAGGFTIATFDSSDEVELLVSLLMEITTDPVEVIEIELNE